MNKTFDKWWEDNEKEFTSNALHMSEYHMASVVWEAAIATEREECDKTIVDLHNKK
jgi:hypothetical protein